MGMPILVGAGVGALTSALKGENVLKGAALGGALGGVGGGVGSVLKGGSFAQGAGLSGLGGAASSATPSLAVAGTPVSEFVKPTLGEIGMANTFNTGSNIVTSAVPESLIQNGIQVAPNMGATNLLGTQVTPTISQTLANEASIFNPVSAGGLGRISDAEYQAMAQASSDPSIFDRLSKYATVDNLKGAAMVANQYQPRPMSPAPQGRITQGQAPQGGIGGSGVEGLLSEIMKRQQQQYQPISLL
jgi:hypothetical protein